MQVNKIRFSIFFVSVMLIQLVINAFTHMSVDIMGIVMIVLLAYGFYSLKFIVLISIFADLIGQWYLGSHLAAIIIIGFFTVRLVSYFRMSNFVQKVIVVIFFYSIFTFLIAFINGILHNYPFDWYGYIIEVLLFCPLILLLLSVYVIKLPVSFII